MIVPRFRIVQTDEYLIVIVKVPYVKISNAEVYVEKYKFTFYLKPYLLNLNFKQALREGDPDSGVYDHNTYEITFKLKKQNHGEHFEDTDMINSLLNRKKKEEKKSVKIEVLGGENFHVEETKEGDSQNIGNLEPKKPHEIYSYGFNRSFTHFFDNLEEELLEIAEIDPDKSNLVERKELKLLGEEQNFDVDHYLADKFENPELDEIICQKLPLYGRPTKTEDDKNVDFSNRESAMSKFTDEEWNLIVRLPKKEYLIENAEVLPIQLIDILYAFLYEYRIFERSMQGDFTSESGWTITKLSATLSCFVEEDNLRHAIIGCIRRSLIFPLYRNFDLSLRVLDDLINTLKAGKLTILKAFLKIKYIFERAEPRYLLNTLYIDDFCIYLQNLDQKVLDELALQIEAMHIEKKELGLDLEEIEKEALEVIDEAENEPKNQESINENNQDKVLIEEVNELDKLE